MNSDGMPIMGTIARANSTQTGCSGAMVPSPVCAAPPFRTKAATSRKLSVSIGEFKNVTTGHRQAGERRSRKVALSGVRP